MSSRAHFYRSFFSQAIIAGLLVGVGFAAGRAYRPNQDLQSLLPLSRVVNTKQPDSYQEVDFGYFWKVWEILERDYLDVSKLDHRHMVDGAIAGMTAALGDPHTVYLPPVDQKRAAEDLAGAFYGVGIQLGYVDKSLAVVAPLSGTPAEKLGIKAGDLILHVKDAAKNLDEDTTGWTLDEAVEKIRGAAGTYVTLTLYRDGSEQPFTVEVPRGEIVVPSAELEVLELAGKKVAHLKLTRFGDRTNGELEASISSILVQRPELAGIILDVRNNPGGYLDEAIDIASEFVDGGVVVKQQSKYDTLEYKTTHKARLATIPIVVVVNRGSASASEILAGALRDRRQSQLVGERTFGKGTVQDARELDNGAGLHVTVARWLLPNGDWINEEGIPVDVEVEDDPQTDQDEVLLRAAQLLP